MSEAPITEAIGKRPNAWSRFWRGVWLFILWLLRLIVAIGGGVLLGAAIFYVAYVGVPQFYQQVLNPIQVNTAKLEILQEDFRSTQESFNVDMRTARDEIRTLRKTVNDQQVTIHSLQASLDAEKENRTQLLSILQSDTRAMDSVLQLQGIALGNLETDIASSKASSEAAAADLAADLDMTDSELATVSARAAALSDALDALAGQLDSTKASLDSLSNQVAVSDQDLEASAAANEASISTLAKETSGRFSALEEGLLTVSTDLGAVQTQVADVSTVITMPITLSDRFERRLVMMQAWQEILKARLHLLEKNAGLATQSLELAQANVAKYAALSTDLSEQQLAPIMAKVSAAAALVEEDPFVAIQELEIVWHNLEQLVSAPVGDQATAEETVPEETTAEEGAPAAEEGAPAEGESPAPAEGTEEGGGTEAGGEGSTEGGGSTGTGG